MTYYSKCLEILDYFKKGYFTLNPDSTAVYLQNSIQANIIYTYITNLQHVYKLEYLL